MSRPEPRFSPAQGPSRAAGSRATRGPLEPSGGPYGPHEGHEPRRREPADATRGPAGPPGPRKETATSGVRLTGRGAILALLVLSFLGLIVSDLLGWGLLSDLTFVAACIVIACYAKPTDLLPVTVCPPLAFFVACVCAKLITSAGGTSAAEGTLVTLATSAPWLFLGTAVTIFIALRRGLLDNIRELRHGLQGRPDGPAPARARNILGDAPGSGRSRRG